MKKLLLQHALSGALKGALSLCILSVALDLIYGQPIVPVQSYFLDAFGFRAGLLLELLLFALYGAVWDAVSILYNSERIPPWGQVLLRCGWFVLLFTLLILPSLSHVTRETILVVVCLAAGICLLVCSVNWLGSRQEAERIRKRLGLPEPETGRGPFQIQTVLPYLLIAMEVELALPPLLRLVDDRSFPVLTGLLYPYFFLPFSCFFAGFDIGKRFGAALAYPVVCGLLTVPHIFWLYNSSALFHAGMAGGAALLGNLMGAIWRKYRKKK